MIVFGRQKNDDIGSIMFSGGLSACRNYCKSLRPSDYDSISIDLDNGVILKRIVLNGLPAENFTELLGIQNQGA